MDRSSQFNLSEVDHLIYAAPDLKTGMDHDLHRPKLRTWALRREDIQAARAEAEGSGIGPVEPGSRKQPDGAILSWNLSDPYAMPWDGAIPFLISWGETPHPATAIPSGGTLVSLSVVHPRADAVRAGLALLNAGLEVIEGDIFELVEVIRNLGGEEVELR